MSAYVIFDVEIRAMSRYQDFDEAGQAGPGGRRWAVPRPGLLDKAT